MRQCVPCTLLEQIITEGDSKKLTQLTEVLQAYDLKVERMVYGRKDT